MVMVVTDKTGAVVSEREEAGGSNNIAEFLALRDALRYCYTYRCATVEVFTDSHNNESWTFNRKFGKKLNDLARVQEIRREIDGLRLAVDLTLKWVPRESNLAGHYIEQRHGL